GPVGQAELQRTSSTPTGIMESAAMGRCRGAFWMALLFDMAGLSLLLMGALSDVFFADLLIYSGGVGLLFSLLWWVFWYVGNLEVPPDELRSPTPTPPAGRPGPVARRRRRFEAEDSPPRQEATWVLQPSVLDSNSHHSSQLRGMVGVGVQNTRRALS
uniref:Transmembrane protein 238 like n=1 Tax=Anolis carolinensis TaxID=28377 RepID=A0A803SXE4_ANOCA